MCPPAGIPQLTGRWPQTLMLRPTLPAPQRHGGGSGRRPFIYICIYTYISLCTSICICMCTYTPTHIYIHVYTTLHACDHFLSRRSRCTKTGTKSERKARKTIPELRKELTESHFLQRSRYSGNPENAPLSVDTSVSLPNFTKRRGVTRRPP